MKPAPERDMVGRKPGGVKPPDPYEIKILYTGHRGIYRICTFFLVIFSFAFTIIVTISTLFEMVMHILNHYKLEVRT